MHRQQFQGARFPVSARQASTLPASSAMRASRYALLAAWLVGCSPAATPIGVSSQPRPSADAGPKAEKPVDRLARGLERLAKSRYDAAEADLRAAAEGEQKGRALLGLAELLVETGRYEQAIERAREATAAGKPIEAAVFQGQALRRQGKLDEAVTVLRGVAKQPKARRARLLLAEVLIEQGKRAEAEAPLMSLIEDYNADRITAKDGRGLAMVGRAAHLLRSPHDANDAFNQAERVLEGDAELLLWRAELFLEKYDPGHAEEVTAEVLKQAPNHPRALVMMAHVKLDQALDFDEAERLANQALKVNPKSTGAYFVLAGIALRDMELELADQRLDAGLKHDPKDLELLSMRATAEFLADDEPGFEKAKQAVLELNPEYSKLYRIVGEYADWEHRYDEIVKMMREAVRIDSEDAKAYAQLGLNLIRAGDDQGGVRALSTAFDKDPFNVRVYNTLNLFEKVIPESYVSVKRGRFTIRYHKDEKPILDRYVPDLLDQAWGKMVDKYGFRPQTPVGVELYAERPNFAIRTSGLPQTAIQGVCFGHTLASMSPRRETFNLGMTLWHELAHVFHIQLSKSHVPRWFTEGLAEYETLVERPEWAREHDPDLYRALRSGRLPRVGSMNRAFTRAEQLSDVATAYYASSQILVMLADEYGMKKLSRMLKLWGEGQRTEQVVQAALGVTPDELDRKFRAWAKRRLARYESQFVPMHRTGGLDAAKAAAKAHPKDPKEQTRLALALLRAGEAEQAEKHLALALKLDEGFADALYLRAKLHGARKQPKPALALLHGLVKSGHDGYDVQMLIAAIAQTNGDVPAVRTALAAAHRFDETQGEPLQGLSSIAEKLGDDDARLSALRKLAMIEQHDPRVYQQLIGALLEKGEADEAVKAGESAVYADMEGMRTHAVYAEALAAKKRWRKAVFELETALLCPGRPKEKADVHAQLAETYLKMGRRGAAVKQAAEAKKLDADNERLKKLKL